MTRRTKLDKATQGYICAAVEAGANIDMRCYNGDISKTTYFNWLNRGEKARELVEAGQRVAPEERRYLSFLDAIEAARASYAFKLQQVIANAAEHDPAEARRELQRLYPDDYMPVQRTELAGPDGGPVEHRIIIEYADDHHDAAEAPASA